MRARSLTWALVAAASATGAGCRSCEGATSPTPLVSREAGVDDAGPTSTGNAAVGAERATYPLSGGIDPSGLFGLTLGTRLADFRRRFPDAAREETGLWPFELRPGIRAEALFVGDELAFLLAHPCTGTEDCRDTGRQPTDLEPACGGPPSIFPAPRGQLNQVEACVEAGRVIMRSAGPAAPVVVVDERLLPPEVRALASLAREGAVFGADVEEEAVRARVVLGEGARLDLRPGPSGRGVCRLRLDVVPGQGISSASRMRKQLAIATSAFVQIGDGWAADVRASADPAWRLTLVAGSRGPC